MGHNGDGKVPLPECPLVSHTPYHISHDNMVVSLCRGTGPPSSGIVLETLFLLAADLRRHPTSAAPRPRRELG